MRELGKKFSCFKKGKISLRDIQCVSIEFCSVCNLRCRYCHLKQGDRSAYLSLNLYEKLLFELCGNKQYRQDIIMEWPISGCFFLHPQYKEIVRLTAGFKRRYPAFSPWVILNDNMMLFDEEKVDFILGQGVVKKIFCSIDGVNKESFEYMRPGAKFETVIKNTRYLLKKNKAAGHKVIIQVHNGNDDVSKKQCQDACYDEIFKEAHKVSQWEPRDWNDSFHTKSGAFSPRAGFCSFVFDSVTLSSSGAVIKCCNDLKEQTKYGDFSKDTLESIWRSQKRRDFLELMSKGERRKIPGCHNCSIGFSGKRIRG
ncbi:MAG: SPASM domain-containing protein [Candidatus Omnitrophica bacterium]|nr:SPASM domain-containing protein [Candidatus Omnitrophota bacterium]